MTTETMREAVKGALRQHIKCDATGLAPAVAGVFLVGFEDAADAAIRTVLERLREPSEAMIRVGTAAISFDPEPPADTGGDPDYEDEARYAWQSMLDAAAREVG